jgi:hypothetical protein
MLKIGSTKTKLVWQKFLCSSALLLAALLISGCAIAEMAQGSASDTPLPPTLISTRETIQPIIEPSSTASVAQTPTSVPLVKLPVEIQKQNLIELFSTNGGCDFPCWWSISPGDSIQKVSELAPMIGKSLRSDGPFFYYTISLDDLNAPDLDINYYVDSNQIVQRMEITLSFPSRFRDYHIAFEKRLSLSSLLRHYGKPSEVLLLVAPLGSSDIPREYALFLLYDVQDFGVVYTGLVDSEDPIRICSIKINDYHLKDILIYLKNPRQNIAKLNRLYVHDLKSLNEVASMDMDDFYQAFSAPSSTECIETDIEKWSD